MTDFGMTLEHPTISLYPVDPNRAAVLRACQKAAELPWYAYVRRSGWISTAKHLKRMSELSAYGTTTRPTTNQLGGPF